MRLRRVRKRERVASGRCSEEMKHAFILACKEESLFATKHVDGTKSLSIVLEPNVKNECCPFYWLVLWHLASPFALLVDCKGLRGTVFSFTIASRMTKVLTVLLSYLSAKSAVAGYWCRDEQDHACIQGHSSDS